MCWSRLGRDGRGGKQRTRRGGNTIALLTCRESGADEGTHPHRVRLRTLGGQHAMTRQGIIAHCTEDTARCERSVRAGCIGQGRSFASSSDGEKTALGALAASLGHARRFCAQPKQKLIVSLFPPRVYFSLCFSVCLPRCTLSHLLVADLVTLGDHHHVAAPALILLHHERDQLLVRLLQARPAQRSRSGSSGGRQRVAAAVAVVNRVRGKRGQGGVVNRIGVVSARRVSKQRNSHSTARSATPSKEKFWCVELP